MTKKNKKILFSFLGTLSISASIAAVAVACRPDTGKNGGKTGGTDTGNNPEKPKVPNNPETPEKPKVPETPKTPETPKKPEDGQKTPDTKPEDGKKTPEGPESPDKDKNPGGDAKTPETPESPDKDKKPGGDAKPTPPPADKPGEKVENKVTTITYTPETTTAKVEFEFENIVTAEQTVSVKFNANTYTMKGNGTKKVTFNLSNLTKKTKYLLSVISINGHEIEKDPFAVGFFSTKDDVVANKVTSIKSEDITDKSVSIVVTFEHAVKDNSDVEVKLKGIDSPSHKVLGEDKTEIKFTFSSLSAGTKYEIEHIKVNFKAIDLTAVANNKSFTTTGIGSGGSVTPPKITRNVTKADFTEIGKDKAKLTLTFDQDVLEANTVEVTFDHDKKFTAKGKNAGEVTFNLDNLEKKTTYTINKITIDGANVDIAKLMDKSFTTLDEMPKTKIPDNFKVSNLQWTETNSTTSTVTVIFTTQFPTDSAEVTVKVNGKDYKANLDTTKKQAKVPVDGQLPGTDLNLTEVLVGGSHVDFDKTTTEDAKHTKVKDIDDKSLNLTVISGSEKVQINLEYPTSTLPIINGYKYFFTLSADEAEAREGDLDDEKDTELVANEKNAELTKDVEVEVTPTSSSSGQVSVKFVLNFHRMLDKGKLHFTFKKLKYGVDKEHAKSIPLTKLAFDEYTKAHYEINETPDAKVPSTHGNGGQQQAPRQA
ncbi:Vmc-like lipoprotein signal peptide domain-containing protein [Ureaplasma canigenitalium]|uniref:Vmc-like lipoprotein signal peptide domain-containing protein n=1 Tax=Ureaplasma canigenitalium TaxID=42092 RepID=UPI0004E11477|nr:DUF1410 domain-containing protein [Ureaplasma canigenitalium]